MAPRTPATGYWSDQVGSPFIAYCAPSRRDTIRAHRTASDAPFGGGPADGEVLLCETPRDVHILPGGQLEAGETIVEAACREVLEETGWQVDSANAEMVGFIHRRHVSSVPQDHRFPHPDFIHAVLVARADVAHAPDGEWADAEGWEVRSGLRPVDEVRALVDAGQLAFLEAALLSGGATSA